MYSNEKQTSGADGGDECKGIVDIDKVIYSMSIRSVGRLIWGRNRSSRLDREYPAPLSPQLTARTLSPTDFGLTAHPSRFRTASLTLHS